MPITWVVKGLRRQTGNSEVTQRSATTGSPHTVGWSPQMESPGVPWQKLDAGRRCPEGAGATEKTVTTELPSEAQKEEAKHSNVFSYLLIRRQCLPLAKTCPNKLTQGPRECSLE